MVIFEMSREELAEFYAKVQKGGKNETFATCNDMKQPLHPSQHEEETRERHSPINPSPTVVTPVGGDGSGAIAGYGQVQPHQLLHLQHYKPNGPATFSQDLFSGNQQWTALSNATQHYRGEMSAEQAQTASELNQTAGYISPHSMDSYTQLPTISKGNASVRYLQSEPLPSIISQQFQQIPLVASAPYYPSRSVYPPNILIPQQQCQTSSAQYEDQNGMQPSSSNNNICNDPFISNQNFPISFQPGSSSSPPFACVQNIYQTDEIGLYQRGEFYPNVFSAPSQPPYYGYPQTWAVAGAGPSNASGEAMYYGGYTDYNPNPGYTCNICYKIFPTRYRLKSHSLVHTEIKAFQCEVCKKNFGRSHDRRRHMKLHTKEKTVKTCSSCGKAFSRSDALQRHLRLACKRDVAATEQPNLLQSPLNQENFTSTDAYI